MTAERIDGKAFAAALRERVGEQAAKFSAAAGRKAGLAVVLVGEDPASQVYVGSKHKATVAAGMESFEHRLPADTSEADMVESDVTMGGGIDDIVAEMSATVANQMNGS